MSVPVVDLSRFSSDDPRERDRVASETDSICRDIGFFSVVGHGVPESDIHDVYELSKAFFRTSVEEKARVRQPHPHVVRGYIGFAAGALGATRGEVTPADLKESYTIGREASGLDEELGPNNLWPQGNARFRDAWLTYYNGMERLSRTLMRLFARALHLDETYFDTAMRRHTSLLSAIFYPDQLDPPAEGQLRAGAHTDFDVMTILRPDNAPGGLELMTKSGRWESARPTDKAFLINIGDMMARWTNDRWVSTLHRVVNPPRDMTSGTERLSLGFFLQPHDDHVVECLPSCRDAWGHAKYEPVRTGDYIKARFASQVVSQQAKG